VRQWIGDGREERPGQGAAARVASCAGCRRRRSIVLLLGALIGDLVLGSRDGDAGPSHRENHVSHHNRHHAHATSWRNGVVDAGGRLGTAGSSVFRTSGYANRWRGASAIICLPAGAESLEMNWLANRCEGSGCGAGGMLAAGAGERVMGDERWRG
jgi:hypothetical protein